MSQLTVLVVENDEYMLYFYRHVLWANGYRVIYAVSLLEAEAVIASGEKFEAMIVDGNVTDGKTTQLVTDIRSRYQNVTILAATNDDDLRRELVNAGADKSVEKFNAPYQLITILMNDKSHPG